MEPLCEECPLCAHWMERRKWSPVPSEINPGTDIILVGEAPRMDDTTVQRPFMDAHGVEVVEALQAIGESRKSVSWANVCACRFPHDKPDNFLAALRKTNRTRVRAGKEPVPSPMDCCRPRLQAELDAHTNIITVGSLAAKAVLPGNPSLGAIRGGPTRVGTTKVLPAHAPYFIRHKPQWRSVFRGDIAKAFRYFKGKLRWENPAVFMEPSAADLRAFLEKCKASRTPVSYDVETDGIESMTCELRCIGIGTKDTVYIVPLLTIGGEPAFYLGDLREEMQEVLRWFFVDSDLIKIGHNAGYYDRIVIEQHLGVTPLPLIDTILLHKLARSEYPHGLAHIGSVETDVPAWKSEHTATTAQSDIELWRYCATDVAVTARIAPIVYEQVKQRDQLSLYSLDLKLQEMCVGMHRLGIRIDEERRKTHERTLLMDQNIQLTLIQEQVGGTFNPNSHDQVRRLLFDKWSLPAHSYTGTGEPSTNAATLRWLVANPLLDEQQRIIVNSLRKYRKVTKLLDTYVRKLSPDGGWVDSDGYVYPDYNVHGTVSGRFSSSNPNFQNIPYQLRNIFVPAPGMVYVGADFDQLELRLASALSGATHYLDAFGKREIDPHNLTGEMMFGDEFWSVDGAPDTKLGKGSGQFKSLRDLAKTICFASLYGAAPPKVHELLMQAEDKAGNLLYAHYSIREVRALHRRWLRAAPQFEAWWEQQLEYWRINGYVEEPVLRRRRYFHQEDFNAIVNFPVQAGGFSIVAQGMLDLIKEVPFIPKERRGLVNQLHDAVLLQVPEAHADTVKRIVTDCLTRRVDGLPVTFTADAHVGYSWDQV